MLEINLKELNIDINDIISIMSRYNLKKKYYRLKDGTFLNLENDNIEFLNRLITGADLEYKELETGLIRLPIHRALYLEKILKFLPEVTIEKNRAVFEPEQKNYRRLNNPDILYYKV